MPGRVGTQEEDAGYTAGDERLAWRGGMRSLRADRWDREGEGRVAASGGLPRTLGR